jgi:hypothetical protein
MAIEGESAIELKPFSSAKNSMQNQYPYQRTERACQALWMAQRRSRVDFYAESMS